MVHDEGYLWLKAVASGDKQAREKLIEHYRPFILNEAQRTCRRVLQWGRDDELSVALIAFNEAIDSFRESKGGSFKQFCRMVIRRRLIDYFRRVENKIERLPSESAASQPVVEEDWERAERAEEIEVYRRILKDFNLSFELVANARPKHEKTKDAKHKKDKKAQQCR